MSSPNDKGEIFEQLLHLAGQIGYSVRLVPFKTYDGRVKHDCIGIRQDMSIDDINYNLAHELAHVFLHYDKGCIVGDSVSSEKYLDYEEQADRAAKLLLSAVSVR